MSKKLVIVESPAKAKTIGGYLGADYIVESSIGRIRDIPGVIVQGRYDMVCPPISAFELHRAWPGSELKLVADGGHALSEPGITAELLMATDAARAGSQQAAE